MNISEKVFIEILTNLCQKHGPKQLIDMDKATVAKYAKASILLEREYEQAKQEIEKNLAVESVPTGRPEPNEWQLANAPQLPALQSIAPSRTISPKQLEEVALSNSLPSNDRGPY